MSMRELLAKWARVMERYMDLPEACDDQALVPKNRTLLDST